MSKMNNKYLVIDQNGELRDARIFALSPACPAEFKIVIEREALGIKPGLDKQSELSYWRSPASLA